MESDSHFTLKMNKTSIILVYSCFLMPLIKNVLVKLGIISKQSKNVCINKKYLFPFSVNYRLSVNINKLPQVCFHSINLNLLYSY